MWYYGLGLYLLVLVWNSKIEIEKEIEIKVFYASPIHACSVALVLNPATGLLSLQHQNTCDDFLEWHVSFVQRLDYHPQGRN